MGVFGFTLSLFLLLPAYGLATLLFTGPDVINGVRRHYRESLPASSFILLMLSIAVFIGGLSLSLKCRLSRSTKISSD